MSPQPRRFSDSLVLFLLLVPAAQGEPSPVRVKQGDTISAIAFSPDGKTLVSASWDRTVRLWDVATGKEMRAFIGHQAQVECVAFSPDGKQIASAGWDRTLRLWDVATGKEIRQIGEHPDGILAIAFSPDGQTLASGNQDQKNQSGTLHLWDVATGHRVHRLLGHLGPVSAIAFAPDGKTLVSGGIDQTLRFWDVASGKEQRRIERLGGQQNWVFSLAFSPDGRLLAAGSADKLVRLWETTGLKELRRYSAHQDKVRSVAFSPDGRTLMSGSIDRTIRLWELASGKERGLIQPHRGGVRAVAFSPDGRTIASGSSDSTVLIGDGCVILNDGKPSKAELTADELNQLWMDLASEDAVKAQRAMAGLAASKQSVPFLQGRLQQVSGADNKHIAELIADLDHDDFAIRERATTELAKIVDQAALQLRRVLEGSPSAELRRRVEQLLQKVEGRVVQSADRLRMIRTLELLERLGTMEVRCVFETLVQKGSDPWLGQEAKAALERLTKRPPQLTTTPQP